MKRLLLVAALAVTHSAFAAPAAVAAAPTATEANALTNDDSKVAYSLGFVFGKNNAAAIENLDIEKFVSGFKDGYGGKQGLLSEDDIKKVLTDYKERRMAQAQEEFQKQGEENKTKGATFLVENAKKASAPTITCSRA